MQTIYFKGGDVVRLMFSLLYGVFIVTLIVCTLVSYHSRKPIGKTVALLETGFLPPVVGNLLIIGSTNELVSTIGCYIYFVGMAVAMFSLTRFTAAYCNISRKAQKVNIISYIFLIIDIVQLLLNPIFGHAFDTESITVDGSAYFRLIPKAGQHFHRLVCYGIFFAVIIIFICMIRKTSRITMEKYAVILTALIIGGLWETFYIFSRTPINTSMIGFVIFALLTFYFSLYYRPLRLLDRMLSDIVSEMSEALFVFDTDNTCIWANKEGCNLTEIDSTRYHEAGVKLEELFGGTIAEANAFTHHKAVGFGDNIRYYRLEKRDITDDKESLSGSYLKIRDVTEHREKMKREMFEANHDTLTGLYTQQYLYQRIRETLDSSKGVQYYIIYVDVKNFKVVNDIFGSDFGDYAIQCIAKSIEMNASERSCYGRLVGDTFGVLTPKEDFDADSIEQSLSVFKVKNEKAEYPLLIHLGVYEVAPEDSDISVMFDRAHLALSLIQDDYHTHISYYDNTIRQKIIWNQSISAQLREATANRDLRPYLQPIADTNGRIVGAEALARWIHLEHGFLSPGSFIPVFEKNGMIVEVDKYMWRCACEILARWKREKRDLFISVNISPKDFYFIDVVSEIRALVEEYSIEPSKLRIEITETVMMNDSDTRTELMNHFRDSGFIVEMDDFGSGYSSLSLLKDMPVDVLKIDMKFLGKTSKQEKANTIVKNIINLSRELGICSLTEGVETQTQYLALSEMGCELFQGYYFAKPMPVEEFDKMIEEQKENE